MVAGVGRDFVLRVNGVNLFVALVHEDVLGAVLLHAPGGALRTAFLGIFRAAHVVGNPAGPRTVGRRSKGSGKQSQGRQKEKSRLHVKTPQRYRINPSADKFRLAQSVERVQPREPREYSLYNKVS